MSSILLQYLKIPKVRANWRAKRGTISDFLTSIVAKHQKIEGGPFGEKSFPKKSLAVPKKTERGDPLVSPGMVCYAEKQEKTFLVQFARPNDSISHHKIS